MEYTLLQLRIFMAPQGHLRQDTHLDLTLLDYIKQHLQKWYSSRSITPSEYREYFDVSFFIIRGCGGMF